MKLQRIPLSRLKPAPYNPRVTLRPGDPGWERLKRSLSEFDLVQPLVWNRTTGHIVGGHQRLAILRHEGVTEVECVVVDLPPEREKALNIALNNEHVAGRWEPQKLVDLLSELQAIEGFDATLTGFDNRQMRDLLFSPAPIPLPEEESAPSPTIECTFEIPRTRWPHVQDEFNRLLAAEPALRLHVRER